MKTYDFRIVREVEWDSNVHDPQVTAGILSDRYHVEYRRVLFGALPLCWSREITKWIPTGPSAPDICCRHGHPTLAEAEKAIESVRQQLFRQRTKTRQVVNTYNGVQS